MLISPSTSCFGLPSAIRQIMSLDIPSINSSLSSSVKRDRYSLAHSFIVFPGGRPARLPLNPFTHLPDESLLTSCLSGLSMPNHKCDHCDSRCSQESARKKSEGTPYRKSACHVGSIPQGRFLCNPLWITFVISKRAVAIPQTVAHLLH